MICWLLVDSEEKFCVGAVALTKMGGGLAPGNCRNGAARMVYSRIAVDLRACSSLSSAANAPMPSRLFWRSNTRSNYSHYCACSGAPTRVDAPCGQMVGPSFAVMRHEDVVRIDLLTNSSACPCFPCRPADCSVLEVEEKLSGLIQTQDSARVHGQFSASS